MDKSINQDYLTLNKQTWNTKTKIHLESSFYDNTSFIAGRNSLNEFELDLLGDVKGKKVLHLQCHFGQDSISLARMGAEVTAVDLSDESIRVANELAVQCNQQVNFICCDLYDLNQHLEDHFDLVFTSYGTIIWLPDLNQWAQIVSSYMKQGAQFVMADFHPVVWMYNDDFSKVIYPYLNKGPILEHEEGTYASKNSELKTNCITWNHGLSEAISALLDQGLSLKVFKEHDFSPYNFVAGMQEFEKGKFRIKTFEDRVPLVFSMCWVK